MNFWSPFNIEVVSSNVTPSPKITPFLMRSDLIFPCHHHAQELFRIEDGRLPEEFLCYLNIIAAATLLSLT